MLEQLVAVALRQPNWRIIGVMFAVATVTLHDLNGVDAPGSDSVRQSLVPAFLWLPRTADNVRTLDQLVPPTRTGDPGIAAPGPPPAGWCGPTQTGERSLGERNPGTFLGA